MKFIPIFCVLVFIILIDNASGRRCEQENIFGITTIKSCPESHDPSDAIYCCGPKDNLRCCQNILGDFREEDLEELAKHIPTLIGVVVAVILGLILCCLLCCCCCPFCIIHKKRNRGVIHQPAAERTNPLPSQTPSQPSYAPVQSGPYPTQPAPYPTQPAGYPNQPAPYPTQPAGYPNQPAPYPTQPAVPYPIQPMAPGFAPQPANVGIQMQPFSNELPPPYTEKQQAFNPNY